MSPLRSNLISLAEARPLVGRPDTVFADVRFVSGEPLAGPQAYLRAHVPGAVFFDLTDDLSGPEGVHGGRHPLPDLDRFAGALGRAGIGNDTDVVVYDDLGGYSAARLWFLLRLVGHSRVRLLDEPFAAWAAAGLPVTDVVPTPAPQTFVPRVEPWWVVAMDEVRAKAGAPGVTLVDSRLASSYTAEVPTKYPVNGHIPGAVNYYWEDGRSADGRFLGREFQAARFQALDPANEILVYCNAGVSACPNVLALVEAGFPRVRLYVGSWGDWITYPENEVVVGPHP